MDVSLLRPMVMKLFKLVVLGVGNRVAQVDQKLGQTSFGGGIIPEDIGKCGISKWFRKTLSERLASSIVVTQPEIISGAANQNRTKTNIPQETSNDVLQQTDGLGLDQTNDHVT